VLTGTFLGDDGHGRTFNSGQSDHEGIAAGATLHGVYQARIGRHNADHFKLARIINFDE
jgi:hypothetical protein